jgi:hypothetical protein
VWNESIWKGVQWMHLAEDMDQWQALVNMVMYFWVPVRGGEFLA